MSTITLKVFDGPHTRVPTYLDLSVEDRRVIAANGYRTSLTPTGLSPEGADLVAKMRERSVELVGEPHDGVGQFVDLHLQLPHGFRGRIVLDLTHTHEGRSAAARVAGDATADAFRVVESHDSPPLEARDVLAHVPPAGDSVGATADGATGASVPAAPSATTPAGVTPPGRRPEAGDGETAAAPDAAPTTTVGAASPGAAS